MEVAVLGASRGLAEACLALLQAQVAAHQVVAGSEEEETEAVEEEAAVTAAVA